MEQEPTVIADNSFAELAKGAMYYSKHPEEYALPKIDDQEVARAVANKLREIANGDKNCSFARETNDSSVYETLDGIIPEENKYTLGRAAIVKKGTTNYAGNVKAIIIPLDDKTCLTIADYWHENKVNKTIIMEICKSKEPQAINYTPYSLGTCVVNISGEDFIENGYSCITGGEQQSINLNETAKPIKDLNALATMLENCFQDVGVDKKGNNK